MLNTFIDFTSGVVAGITNCVSGFFLDTIKVRMQINPDQRSIITTLKNIVKTQGFLELFSGIYYPLITMPIASSINFASYQYYKALRQKTQLTFLNGLESGAVSGFVVSFVSTPADLVKVIMQSDSQKRFSHSRDCMRFIVKNNGILGLLKGNVTMILRQIPGYAAQFSTYQYLKGLFVSEQHVHLTILETLIVCPPAAILGWVFSYPQDTIKTRIQSLSTIQYAEKKWIPDGGFYECGLEIYKLKGWKGFFVGLRPCLIRASYSDALGFIAYEKCREVMWEMRTIY